jgi:hypothetical protein
MSPALRALVDADNQRPGPSDADRKRVYAALGVSLGVLPAGAIVAAHAAGATATTGAAAAATTTTSASALATAVSAASTVGRIALIAKAPLVGVGVGAVLGATLTAYVVKGPVSRWTTRERGRHAAVTAVAPPRAPAPAAPALAPSAPTIAPAAEPLPAPAIPAAAEAAPAPEPERSAPHHAAALREPAAPRARDDRAAEAPAPAPAPAAPGALAAEQALLDPARVALARGDGAAALERLSAHERRFPSGALAQEREAMAIRALALTGDVSAARGRAGAFRARYPGSLLWPMIAASLDAPPGARR